MFRVLYVFVVSLTRLAFRSGRSKDLEIIVLRHQIGVSRRQIDRPAITDDDRSLLAAIAQALPRARRAGWIVTPDTLLRWHRRRIHGELARLGHRIGASTVWQILKHHGIDPAPRRGELTWTAFLRSQAAVACAFATVDSAVLRRYYVLFFIDVTGRTVFFAGITAHPTGVWTTQAARNLFLVQFDQLESCRTLVRDSASQFGAAFDEVFRTEGMKILKTPVQTPVANSFAKRWIGTLRRERLDRTIIWNGQQLERLVVGYIDHYNQHRPHRSLDQQPPRAKQATAPDAPTARFRVTKHSRCNGLIHEYHNAA